MLKRQNRLTLRTHLKNSTTYHTPLFVVKVSKNGLLYNRYGFVVSKKIDKRAAARNRIKRILRMCIEENLDIIQPGFDMLFLVRLEIAQKTKEEICMTILNLLKKENYLT